MKKVKDKLFKDKEGNVVVGQMPNKPLILFLIFIVASFWLSPFWQILVRFIAAGFLLWWAWLEMKCGANTFRKILGFIASMAVLIYCIQFLL